MKKIFLLLSASYLCNAADSENTVIVDSLKNQFQHLSAAAQLWHESNTPPTITVEAAKASLQSHLSDGLPACLLALQKSEVVGMVRVVAGSSKDFNGPDACPQLSSSDFDEEFPWICGLEVPVPHRKKGIGEILAISAVQFVKSLGKEKAFFKVREELVPACSNRGCQKLPRTTDDSKEIIMSCSTINK